MRKIHSNKLHAKLGHPGEYRMRATTKFLLYSVKGTLEVCKVCATAKINQKLLHKQADERNLKMGKMIYLYLIPQKKPSYGGSENWILIQDSDTRQKLSLFMKGK